ncbi:MAG: hydrolase [Actinobacteria bacterium]|nr:MAG: hydrolase [Actinomycetota bacterium]
MPGTGHFCLNPCVGDNRGVNLQPTALADVPAGDIRLIVSDLDGTLLDENGQMPEELWAIVRELHDKGIVFAPASGRQYWTLLDIFDPIRDGLTVIAENGAIVMHDGEEISSLGLDYDTAAAVVRRVREQKDEGINGALVLCCQKTAYIERTDEDFTRNVIPYYHNTTQVPDLLSVISGMENGTWDDKLLKVAQFDYDDVSISAESSMGRFSHTHQYVVSGKNWADLMHVDVDKGPAVAALQRRLGVTEEQTLIFGDFLNDLGMMKHAAYSFAMANAHPQLLAAAHYVAPPNTEQGVLKVIRELVL